MQWLAAFRTSIEYSGAEIRYQRQLLEKRRQAREEEKEREEDEMADIGMQLENEKKARVNTLS